MRTPTRCPAQFLGLIVLLLTAALCHADVGTFTLTTYNVENFNDVFDDPYTQDEGTRVKPRPDIERVARLIDQIDPDVIGVQEVENAEVLTAMVQELMPAKRYDYIVTTQTNGSRGMTVGMISRKPIISMTSHRFRDLTLPGEDRTWRFARDLMEVKLQAGPARVLTLFIVHFKSKYDSADDKNSVKWRLAEATMARKIIEEAATRDPDGWYAIIGDFNDTPDSPTVKAFLDPLPNGKPLLIDVHKNVSESSRVTYLRPPYRSTIDYILVSPAMAKQLVKGSAEVITSESMLGGSDHAPVIAKFNLD